MYTKIKLLNSLMVLLLLAVGVFPTQASAGPLVGNLDHGASALYKAPALGSTRLSDEKLSENPLAGSVAAPPDWGVVSGVVTSTGQCDAQPAVLEGAEVIIKGSGETYTATTDSDGRYLWWLPAAEGPLTIRASAESHQAESVSAVAITAGYTTTQDFDLRLLAPCLRVEPGQLAVTLTVGYSETLPLNLLNDGAASTVFEITQKTHIAMVLVAGNDTSGSLMATTLAGLGYTS